ncbi:EAL domain-containing protein [Neobacillus sp. SAB-20_R2A]|uniref:EAL domain-containing protein n=1 Tax=Neobacillus sp. SAB-20_R2A TaxID=3120519 RepID=UPI003C6E4886
MARRIMNMLLGVMEWGKILLPAGSLRFYPPQFILRNPVLEGVTAAFQSGLEAAVFVFHLQNMNELSVLKGKSQQGYFMKQLKKYFRHAVQEELKEDEIIALHDFYGDVVTLIMKVDVDKNTLSDMDHVINGLLYYVEGSLQKHYPSQQIHFETGYMFIDKKHYSISDSIQKAHRQAIAMAEKRLAVKYDDIDYMINQIITSKNIRLLAQPIIDVATNEIRAWELLTRGPKGTAVENPLPLFSVARQTGTLYALEMLVLEKAFEQIKTAKCRQDIFINCTPLTLGNIRFTRDIKNLLQRFTSISPKQITIEITENDSIEGLKNFIYNIKMLRLMGFRIAIDDTGAGYSNLSTISEIMPDIIKIDRSLIQNIDKNSLKESMLKGILLVAREAGSLVVAEGIENEDEASVLSRNKVDLAQGYFYAPPTVLNMEMAT